MFKEKWAAIVAAVLGLLFIFRGYTGKKQKSDIMDKFKDELHANTEEKKQEAMKDAEDKYDDTVGSSVDDWLDDQLGPDTRDGVA